MDADGNPDATEIRLGYQEVPTWRIIFGIANAIAGTFTASDVSDAATWAAAVDDDHDHDSTPMCRTLDANIDSTDAGSGVVDVTIDANTSTFLAAVGTRSTLRPTHFDVSGYDAGTRKIWYAKFEITAVNSLDPSGGVPPDPTGNYYTKTESDARYPQIAGGTEVTLTDDATTNVTLGASADYRAFRVFAMVDDGTSFAPYEVVVYHDGTSAYVENLPDTIGDDLSATMSFDADISGGNVRLNITMASHGSNPKLVYRILSIIPVST